MRKFKVTSSRLYFVMTALALFAVLAPFQNCGKLTLEDLKIDDSTLVTTTDEISSNSEGSEMHSPLDYTTVITPQDGHVCTPFGSGQGTSNKSGLKAELRYIDPISSLSYDHRVSKLATAYFDDADSNIVKVNQSVYLADVNVPTRHFENGFSLSDGTPLKDNKGNTLVEFFALRMESVLKLGDSDLEGYYELSTISDDGAVVQVQLNGNWKTLISNDGVHSARMGCMKSEDKILFTKDTRLPIRIYYNQGPATEIANVLLWNYRGLAESNQEPIVPSDSTIHKYCGQEDSNNFWRTSDSNIQAWGLAVLDANWKILKPENFLLANDELNPCSYNGYDLAPNLVVQTQDPLILKLTIAEEAGIHMKVYQVNADGTRAIAIEHLAKQPTLWTQISLLTITNRQLKYQIEVTMEIPGRQIKVLKVYNVSFLRNSPI